MKFKCMAIFGVCFGGLHGNRNGNIASLKHKKISRSAGKFWKGIVTTQDGCSVTHKWTMPQFFTYYVSLCAV